MLLSTRNSLAALESLLIAVQASTLLVDHTHSGVGEALKKQMSNLHVFPLGVEKSGLDTMTQLSHKTPDGPRASTDLDKAIVYTHTSGSEGVQFRISLFTVIDSRTGHPKPVTVTHRQFLKQIRLRSASQYAGAAAYAPVPLFHVSGLGLVCEHIDIPE